MLEQARAGRKSLKGVTVEQHTPSAGQTVFKGSGSPASAHTLAAAREKPVGLTQLLPRLAQSHEPGSCPLKANARGQRQKDR